MPSGSFSRELERLYCHISESFRFVNFVLIQPTRTVGSDVREQRSLEEHFLYSKESLIFLGNLRFRGWYQSRNDIRWHRRADIGMDLVEIRPRKTSVDPWWESKSSHNIYLTLQWSWQGCTKPRSVWNVALLPDVSFFTCCHLSLSEFDASLLVMNLFRRATCAWLAYS